MRTARDLGWLKDFPVERGVRILEAPSAFESIYGAVRQAEGRILTDEQVRRLPLGKGLKHEAEWRVRAMGSERLIRALDAKGPGLNILEVGCGNGWLSAMLHDAGHQVHGIDSFTSELEQAARVFPEGPVFTRADLFNLSIPVRHFDVVLFAASLPYFNDASAALQRAKELIKEKGQVHVIDSMLYSNAEEVMAAGQRSAKYYRSLGFPGMAGHYHAHLLGPLARMNGARVLHAPSRWSRFHRLIGRTATPFTHLVLA